jgi:endonuclease/exonuclease/phosphatase family metal-dependent hydrolase
VPAQVGGLTSPRAVVRPPGADPIDVAVAHPPPPSGPDNMRAWQVGLRVLPPATPEGGLRILLGDFNATLDHSEMRRIVDTGYRDAADVTGTGLQPTWPGGAIPPPVTIDHVLVDQRIGVGDLDVHGLPGSDHRAVEADLQLP